MYSKNGEHPYGDLGQLILFVLFLSVWLLDSFFLHKTTMLAHFVDPAFRLFAALLFLGLGILLLQKSHFVTEKSNREKVITTGPFRYVRHPLYLGILLFYFGLWCLSLSLVSALILLVGFLFYNHIASFEEDLLLQHFGPVYSEYRNNTPKWLPLRFRRTRH